MGGLIWPVTFQTLLACRVSENKKFRIVWVLMFPVAALIIKSFYLLSSVEKFIA